MAMRIAAFAFVTALLLTAGSDLALANADLSDFYLSNRSMAMGGTGVASPEGTDALFLNPAALAGVDTTILQLLDLQGEGSQDIMNHYAADTNAIQQLSGTSPNLGAISTFMGQNAYSRLQDTFAYVGRNFGISLISDVQIGVLAQNAAYPDIEALYQVTNGLQAGFGFAVGKARKHGPQLRIGGSFKVLFRRGGYRTFSLADLVAVGPNTTLTQYFGNFGTGYGADLGVQYYIPFRRKFSVTFGAACTDLGDTTFSGGGDTIKQNFSLGASFSYDLGGVSGILEYDYRNVFTDTDWRKRNHFGLELKLPLFDAYAGLDQAYLSYGLAFDIWILRINAAIYTTELGPILRQDPETRGVVQVRFKL